jgi:hypothetical protein
MFIINKMNQYSILYPEVKPLFYDILRIITMQSVAQMLFSVNNPNVSFLNKTFIQTIIYLSIGVAVFWLVVYKFMLTQNSFKLM